MIKSSYKADIDTNPLHFGYFFHDINGTVGVTPFVVIPAHNLHGLALDHGAKRIEDTGGRIPNDITTDDRLITVFQDTLERSVCRSLDDRIDFVYGHFLAKISYQVNTATGDNRYTQGVTVQLAIEFGDDLTHGFGCTSRGGDDILCGGTGTTHIAMDLIADILVVGIAMYGDHQALFNTKGVV